MEVIEKLLLDLHASIESRDSYANSTAIVASIESIASAEDIDSLELDICANLLFASDNPPSLLEYIVQTTRCKDREVIKAKVSTLKFVAQFLKTNGPQGDTYGEKISLTLIDVFKKEESGEVKAALLLPLKNLHRCRIQQFGIASGDDSINFVGVPLNPTSIKLEQMYAALIEELRYGKKITKGIISESLKLLGILVAVYPLEPSTVQYVPNILSLCNQHLRENFKPSCKDPDFPAIAGSFSCLDRILFQHEENCENSSELWKYLLQTAQTVNSPDVSKYAAAGKAIRLIKNHAGIFKDLIGLNASQSYSIVMATHKSEKTAVLKHSGEALAALMTQISSYLVDNTSSPKLIRSEGVKDALKTIVTLVDGYLLVLKDGNRTDTEEVYLALKGIVNCASSLPRVHILSGLKDVYEPRSIISAIVSSARHSELLSALSSTPDVSLTQYSSQKKSLYLSAVVSIIFAVFLDGVKDITKQRSFEDIIVDSSIQSFLDEYLTITIIGYVKLWKKQQTIVQSTLVKLMYITSYGHSEPDGSEEEGGVIIPRITSTETIIPLNNLVDCIFRTLLTRTAARKEIDEFLNVSSTRISEYTGEVDDRLLFGYLSLWLELTNSSDKTTKTEVIEAYGPHILQLTSSKVLHTAIQRILEMIKELDLGYVKIDDMNLQDATWMPTNIVDQDLLINLNTFFALYIKQQPKKQVIKILDIFLDEIIPFANDHPLVSSFYKLIVSVLEHVQELLLSPNLSLNHFVVDLQNKVQSNPIDFRGELLDASLCLILTTPITVVPLKSLVPSLKQSLLTGSNVVLAIQQLTRAVVSNNSDVDMYLPDLIPLTAVYLERFSHVDESKVKGEVLPLDDRNQNLQYVVLEFLGRIGGMNKLILQNPTSAVQDSLVWSTSKLLDVPISVTDEEHKTGRMNINFDEVFINLTRLCQQWIVSGKDNQLLISCSEAFHSLLIILIGNANGAKKQKDSSYSSFFRNAFPIVLKLASKPLKCQKMFDLLLFQCVRWFSGDSNVHDDEATALLEVLFESISNEEVDNAEREIASKGLEEYFSWSIKQSNGDVKSSLRINTFMNKITTMLSHPLNNFRRGGVQALNKIYKYFREENYLVSKYVMQLVMLLLNTTRHNSESETTKENEQAIFKYEEILAISIAKRGWMNEMLSQSDDRLFPTSLGELVEWLWNNCLTASEKLFRRCCMRCFATFAPLLKSTHSNESKLAIIEYLASWSVGKRHSSTLDGIHAMLHHVEEKDLFVRVEIALDVYTWILTLDLVPGDEFRTSLVSSILDSIPSLFSGLRLSQGRDIQLMYRYMIWIQTLLLKTKQENLERMSDFLRRKQLWSESCLFLILDCLTAIDVENGGESEVGFEDFIGALRHLLHFYMVLEVDSESTTSKLLQEYVRNKLDACIDGNTTSRELQRAKSIINLVSINGLDRTIFGSSYNYVKQLLINSLHATAMKDIVNNYGDDRRVECLFQLCVDLGLRWESEEFTSIFPSHDSIFSQLGSSSASSTEAVHISLSQVLQSEQGSLLLSKIVKILVPSLLKSGTNLSFANKSNIATLLDLLPASNAVYVLETLMLEISTRLSGKLDNKCADIFTANLIPTLQSRGFGLIPDGLLTILLTIDAQISLLCGSKSSNAEFLKYVLNDCCATFQSCSKLPISIIQTRLSWLGYILPGTVSHAPRGRNFTDFSAEAVIECLEELVSIKFPLDSTELNPTSDQGKDYLLVLETYLSALENCGSVVFLKPLLPSFREGSSHRYFSRLCQAVKSIASNVVLAGSGAGGGADFTEVRELCNFCMDLVLDPFQDFVVKRTFFDMLFLPTLSKLSSKQISKLFSSSSGGGITLQRNTNHQTLVKTMYDIVAKEVSLSAIEDEFEVKGGLYLQIACLKIFAFLYDHCSLPDLKSSITQAFVGSESVSGKELTQSLCKITFKMSKSAAMNEQYKDLLLELQTAAYECLAITVSKTQSDEQFFDTFLFKVKPSEDLWSRVTFSREVGDSPAATFNVMSGNFSTVRLGWEKVYLDDTVDTRVTTLRNMSARARVRAGKGGFLSQYLNSSMLGTSSVSQSQVNVSIERDVSESQNQNLGRYSQSQYLEDGNESTNGRAKQSYDVIADDSIVAGWDDYAIFLEMNHLNSIPIMGTLVRTITRMSKLFSAKWKPTVVPFWLQELRSRLSDRSAPQRVRLFVLRLFMNQPIAEIIKPWMQDLLPQILDCAVDDLCVAKATEGSSRGNFHYFLKDLVFLFCDTWKDSIPTALSCYQASKLLNFLLDNILDDDGTILKENTASFCALAKHWMSHDPSSYTLSFKSIVEMITVQGSYTGGAHAKATSRGTIAVRSRLAGLEILQTILESNYPILNGEESGSIVNGILGCVKYPRKEVLESACILSGSMLQKRSLFDVRSRLNPMPAFQDQLGQCVEQQLTQKAGADLMACSIRNITTTYPAFLSRELIMKTLHCFPQLKFRQRYLYLDALVRTTFCDEELKFTELLRPYYKSLLTEVSLVTFGRGSNSIKLPVVQLSTISFLTKYQSELTADVLFQLIGESEADGLRSCVSPKSCIQIRDCGYQFLMELLVKHPQLRDPGSDSQNVWVKLRSTICFLLLTGLTDLDDAAMDLEWSSKHEVLHTSLQYEDPKYWSSSNSSRLGIRRRLLEFFNYDFGLTNILSLRLQTLMTDFFDPSSTEAWLKYASYLSMIIFVSSSSASASEVIFNRGLGTAQNSVARDLLVTPQYLGSSAVSAATPMFALERTTQSLSQLATINDSSLFRSSQLGISSILSQSNMSATQSFMRKTVGGRSKNAGGMIRGTQQFSWTQTQSSSSQMGGGGGELPPAYGTYQWTQTQSELSQSTKVKAELAPGDKSTEEMPPPKSLPSYIINQRVPTRINSSMLETGGVKNYAMFRKVHVAKKLKSEEDIINRHKVTFYRRYKMGELPDICISLTDLIVPLSSVCLLHSGIASCVLHSLLHTFQSTTDFQNKLFSCIASMFSKAKGHGANSVFVGLFLKQLNELINHSANAKAIIELVVKDSFIADLAGESGNYYTGLSLLEDLISSFDKSVTLTGGSDGTGALTQSSAGDSQPTKRKRVVRATKATSSASLEDSDAIANDLFNNNNNTNNMSSKAVHSQPSNAVLDKSSLSPLWSQLLRIYDDLQENEVMVSITTKSCANHSKAQSLKNALDAELRGEYLEAIEIYSSLLDASSEEVPKKRTFSQTDVVEGTELNESKFERQLWFDRGLSCHNKLSDWGKLHDFISTKGMECIMSAKEDAAGTSLLKRNRSGGSGTVPLLDEICSLVPDGSKATKERLIPHYFRALLQSIPEHEDSTASRSKLFGFVDRMLVGNNPSTTSWLESSCSLELAIFSILKSDWSKVKFYSELAYKSFLSKWGTLHPCALQARQKLLLRLEEILEIRDIASVKLDKTLIDDHLLTVWGGSEPSLVDPLSHWTNIALIRQCGLSSSSPPSNLHLAKLYVRTAVASVQQGILTMVKPLLEKNSILRKPVFGKKMVLTIDEVHVVSQYNRKSILRKPLESSDIPNMFQKACGLLQKKVELLDDAFKSVPRGNKAIQRLIWLEQYQVMIMQAEWSAFSSKYEQDKLMAGATLAATLSGVNQESIKLKKFATLSTYFDAVNLVQKKELDNMAMRESCYSTAAQYADQLLGEIEQGTVEMSIVQINETKTKVELLCASNSILSEAFTSKKSLKATEIVAILAVYLLVEGLKYGSSFCSERILRLVSIVETYSDLLQQYFLMSLKSIPAWVFLRYSAQMLGSLDRPEGRIVVSILEAVAKEYPQALFYSFRITSENFGKQGRLLSANLKRMLANKQVDAFIESLVGLTHPELRWSDGMKEIDSRCKVYFDASAKLGSKDKAELGNSILAMFEEVKKQTIEQSWEQVGTKIGRYNMKWAKQIRAEVLSILGSGGKDDKLLANKAVVDKLKALSSKSDPQLASGKVDLQDFSQWLLEYSDVNGSVNCLEIPGQYARYIKSKPAVDTHEYMSSFDSKLLVMSSIRKPKRLKVYGHLGNEVYFLVKGGEDLRNDERIEQLFMLMNYVVDSKLNPVSFRGNESVKSLEQILLLGNTAANNDLSSSELQQNRFSSKISTFHGLSARTYTVIPMSTKVGMLEWVKNTIPLKSIISEELAKDSQFLLTNPNCLESEHSVDLSRTAAYKERQDWIGGFTAVEYHKVFKNATREQAWNIFTSVSAKVPSDLLKRYFKRIAMNAEAFFTLRTEFAKSLAISSIFGYILGIGDRHLDNLLIDMKTGSVVQIDFGICFGIGSSMLPVPELIPFRFTPVLRDALKPLDSLSLIRQYMVKVLQYLRDDAMGSSSSKVGSYGGVIGNALEIYINDPVIDWLRGITAKDKDELEVQRTALESSGKMTWEPTRRIRMAIKKLKGEDPMQVLLEDLKVNGAVAKLDSFKALNKILQAVRTNTTQGGSSSAYGSSNSLEISSGSSNSASGSMPWGESMLGGYAVVSSEVGVNDNDPSRSKSIPVHEQVDLLIKLATDPDILARQWAGLQTWL